MKVLLETLLGSIVVITLKSETSIDIIFSTITHSSLFNFFIRNIKIIILNDQGMEQFRRELMHTKTTISGQRLNVDFSSDISIGKTHKRIVPTGCPILIGYEVLLMHHGKIIRKFIVRQDFELEY